VNRALFAGTFSTSLQAFSLYFAYAAFTKDKSWPKRAQYLVAAFGLASLEFVSILHFLDNAEEDGARPGSWWGYESCYSADRAEQDPNFDNRFSSPDKYDHNPNDDFISMFSTRTQTFVMAGITFFSPFAGMAMGAYAEHKNNKASNALTA